MRIGGGREALEATTRASGSGQGQGWGVRVVVWSVLAIAVLVHLVLDLNQLVAETDSEYLETPLALAAAGQFLEGPASLYGPFQGGNHRVLVQAPLFYRLTGLA